MTRVSFRAYRIGEHETVTQSALDSVVGQHFFVTEGPEVAVDERALVPDDDNVIRMRVTEAMYLSKVIAARVEDGWIVVEADLINRGADGGGWAKELSLGWNNLYTLPPEPASVRWTFTPRPADWSGFGMLTPTRLGQALADRRLRWQAAANDWERKYLAGPDWSNPTRQ